MSQFEWEKGDEGWEEEGEVIVVPSERSWLSFLLAGCILLFIFGVAWWLNRQVDHTEDILIAELKEANFLFDEMYEAGDSELLEELYLPVEGWPLPILGERFLVERVAWGLDKQPLERSSEITILLDSGLNEADVAVTYLYQLDKDDGEKETVLLQQQMFWEKVDGGWRLAIKERPLGTKHQLKGRYFAIDYWGIDSERIEALGLWLEFLMEDFCADPELMCELVQFPISLAFNEPGYYRCGAALSCAEHRLGIDQSATYSSELVQDAFQQKVTVQLLSPFFFGLPVDERGEELLKTVYGRYIFENLIPTLLGVQRRGRRQPTAYMQAQIETTLAEKGVIHSTQQQLATEKIEEGLLLHCPTQENDLFYYQPATDIWQQLSGHHGAFEVGMGDDQLVLYARNGDVYLHENGKDLNLLDRDPMLFEPRISIEWVTGGMQEGILLQLEQSNLFGTDHYFFDLNQCREGECIPQLRENKPVSWSEDGRWLISTHRAEGSSWLEVEDWTTKRVVWDGVGHDPFWLGSAEYGYIQEKEGDGLEQHGALVTALITDHLPRVLVDRAEFEALIPQQRLATELSLIGLEVNPQNSNELLLVGFIWDNLASLRRYYFFSYHRGTEQLRLLMEQEELYSYMMTDNWQAIGLSYFAENGWKLRMYDRITGAERTDSFVARGSEFPPTHDWSLDSQWGTRLESDLLFIFDPQLGQQQLVVPPVEGCSKVRWVKPELMEGMK